MATIRTALRENHFLDLKDRYGPLYMHGGWETLVVVAGDQTKSATFNSSWGWTNREAKVTAESLPAMRVWLTVCESLDPDDKVFKYRRDVSELVGKLAK